MKKYKIISIVVLISLFVISYLIYVNRSNQVSATNEEVLDNSEIDTKKVVEISKIKVDIKGMVNNPGVYEVDDGSRVIDVINMAGGLTEFADTSTINLSKKLKDENVIIIESSKELEKVIEYKYIYQECDCPVFNDACLDKENIINNIQNNQTDDSNNKKTELNNQLISINNGSLDDLQKIPGIGESKAKSIINYREEKGLFNSLEDIMNVSGIGASLFEKIKDYITI